MASKIQKFGSVSVLCEEIPEGIRISAKGGSSEDRKKAKLLVAKQLEKEGFRRVSSWMDIMDKAKRLIDSGQVQMLRNGYNNIVAQVQGDHGTYLSEIGRDDPSSRAITTWQCECPWDQYAWQRTRKWKKYEGRPCAHVLATYWLGQSMPLDEDVAPGQNQDQTPAAPGGATTPSAPPQGEQLQIPGVGQPGATGTPPAPPGAVPGQPTPDLLPPFPQAEQPPPPVSIPGGKPPSPYNPLQYPGGTFSKVAVQDKDLFFDQSQWGNLQVRLNKAQYGIMQGKSEAHGAGQYKEIPANSIGTLMEAVEDLGGQANVIFAGPQSAAGPMQPYYVQAWIPLSDLSVMPNIKPPGPFIRRRTNAWDF